jgi:hypothetical protein
MMIAAWSARGREEVCVNVVGEALAWSDGHSGTLDLIADLAKPGSGYLLRVRCNEEEKDVGD